MQSILNNRIKRQLDKMMETKFIIESVTDQPFTDETEKELLYGDDEEDMEADLGDYRVVSDEDCECDDDDEYDEGDED